jgi:hypothetical protein
VGVGVAGLGIVVEAPVLAAGLAGVVVVWATSGPPIRRAVVARASFSVFFLEGFKMLLLP